MAMLSRPKRHAIIFSLFLLFYLERATAVEFEPMGTSISRVLGREAKAFKSTVMLGKEPVEIFYRKGPNGKPSKLAVVQRGVFEPNCTHTWIVGLEPSKQKVTEIRVIEMSCPHAFPAKEPSFIDQYTGKGPADVMKLKGAVNSIAKATGSCDLTTKAVMKAIRAAQFFAVKNS